MNAQPIRAPFDDIRDLLAAMPGPDQGAVEAVTARQAKLIEPVGSLGRFDDLVAWLAAWQGKAAPTVNRPVVAVYAGNHGVAAHHVSPNPPEVTAKMVEAFAAGGGAINQICVAYGLGLKVFDLALDRPTGDITREDALSERDCAATMAFGMEALAGGTDLLCLGEMGVGGSTAAAAVYNALYGGTAADWVDRGPASDDACMIRKRTAVAVAVTFHAGRVGDPLAILRCLGSRELAAMAGAILAARSQRVPVIVDGYTPTAAAAVLHALNPDAIAHCLFAHVGGEASHRGILERMGVTPLFDFGMRVGEGVGAALAAGLVKAALATHTGTATSDKAGFARRG
ncbi:MAG: nicotinate-nucleotide--dimethylbenzimidazole phosphoribosyltransferase [Bauldia sp.]